MGFLSARDGRNIRREFRIYILKLRNKRPGPWRSGSHFDEQAAKKTTKLDFHLKLSDVPQENTKGFRLNPEHFRDNTDLEDLR